MLDEFSDSVAPVCAAPAMTSSVPTATKRTPMVARLVCRMYGVAPPELRAKLVACLIRPLGTLGVCGVAAGAFGVLLYRGGAESAKAAMGDMARFSNDQIFELVRFVEQVSPDALHDFAMLFNQRSMGMGAFSASVALLLMRALLQKHSSGAKNLSVNRIDGQWRFSEGDDGGCEMVQG